MAKKKTRKRRVRKAKSRRKTRKNPSRKRSRSRKSSRKGRRRNPGNFRLPSVDEAKKHLKHWEKQGVQISAQIAQGMKAPYVGTLADAKAVKLAKVRHREALGIVNAYNLACEKIKATKKVTGAWKCPISTKSVAKYIGEGGNFRPVTKKRAKAYLERTLRWSPRLHAKKADGTVDFTRFAIGPSAAVAGELSVNQLSNLYDKNVEGWLRAIGRRGDMGPRLVEAMTVVGADEAQKILNKAKKNAMAHAKKLADKAAKKAAAKAKRDAKKLEQIRAEKEKVRARLEKALAKLNEEERKLVAATATAARRFKAMKSKRSRRRNPVRRKAKRRRNPAKKKAKRKVRRKAKKKAKRKTRRKRKNPCPTRRKNCGIKRKKTRRKAKKKAKRKTRRRAKRTRRKTKRNSRRKTRKTRKTRR
jgi:hypothetical protein